MLWLVIKSLISGVLVGIVSEAAKRSAAMGALVASLPIVSVLGMVWLWQETKDTNRLADHASFEDLGQLPFAARRFVCQRGGGERAGRSGQQDEEPAHHGRPSITSWVNAR